MHFDDLYGLEVRRCLAREAHEQNGPESEVGGDHDTDPRMLREHALHFVETVLVEPRRADDRVDPVRDAVAQRRHHGVGRREVHGHLDA